MYSSYAHNRAQTEKAPDYAFWIERDYWKLPEAAKLICGRDPMARFMGRPRYNTNWRVIDIIDAAFQAVQQGTLSGDRSALLPVHVMVTPADFTLWAKASGFEIPEPLQALSGTSSTAARQGATAVDTKSFDHHTVTLVARTLIEALPGISLEDVTKHKAMQIVADVQTFDQRRAVLEYLKATL